MLIWNEEEKKKIAEEKKKYAEIRVQREQQLREGAALRKRDEDEMRAYEVGILQDIHVQLQKEKAIEAAKRARDAEALRQLALQNIENDKLLKIIGNLEEKKAALEIELAGEARNDPQSDRYQDVKQELQVVSELIDKAKQQEQAASLDDSDPV